MIANDTKKSQWRRGLTTIGQRMTFNKEQTPDRIAMTRYDKYKTNNDLSYVQNYRKSLVQIMFPTFWIRAPRGLNCWTNYRHLFIVENRYIKTSRYFCGVAVSLIYMYTPRLLIFTKWCVIRLVALSAEYREYKSFVHTQWMPPDPLIA